MGEIKVLYPIDLSPEERNHLITVLKRDVDFQQANVDRLHAVEVEIEKLRSVQLDEYGKNKCNLCNQAFGILFSRGNECMRCGMHVCSECISESSSRRIVCQLCNKEKEWLCLTGEWVYDDSSRLLKKPNKRRNSAPEIESDKMEPVRDCPLRSDSLTVETTRLAAVSIHLLSELERIAESPVEHESTHKNESSGNTAKEKHKFKKKGFMKGLKKHGENKKSTENMNEITDTASEPPPEPNWHKVKTSKYQDSSDEDESGISVGPPASEPDAATGEKTNLKKSTEKTKSTGGRFNHRFYKKRSQSMNNLDKTDFEEDQGSERNNSIDTDDKVRNWKVEPTHRNSPAIGVRKEIIRLQKKKDHEGDLSNDSGVSESPRLNNRLGKSTESLVSLYSLTGMEEYMQEVAGEVVLQLQYDYKTNSFLVLVSHVNGLKPLPDRNEINPYVKTYLLPDRSVIGKRKSKVQRNCLNPVFKEVLKYGPIAKSELNQRQLSVAVWHCDRFGRNTHMGEAVVSLADYPWDVLELSTYELVASKKGPKLNSNLSKSMSNLATLDFGHSPPHLTLSLCYESADASGVKPQKMGKLKCKVRRATCLHAVKPNGMINAFVKGYLLPDLRKSSKRKTSVVKKSISPVWNQDMIFEHVTLDTLRGQSLELTVWDQELFTANAFLGGVRLNLGPNSPVSAGFMDSNDGESTIWRSLMECPNQWKECTLALRPSMQLRSTESNLRKPS